VLEFYFNFDEIEIDFRKLKILKKLEKKHEHFYRATHCPICLLSFSYIGPTIGPMMFMLESESKSKKKSPNLNNRLDPSHLHLGLNSISDKFFLMAYLDSIKSLLSPKWRFPRPMTFWS